MTSSGGRPMPSYRHHDEATVVVQAPPSILFDRMDDHEWLASHMTRSRMMMAGSSMTVETDALHGRAPGATIRMSGRVLGMALHLVETVTMREPPLRKAWETIGQPRLLVIGRYRMGFEIAPQNGASRVTIHIDYDEPAPPWRWLGRLLGGAYARWCTRAMARGVAATFPQAEPVAPGP